MADSALPDVMQVKQAIQLSLGAAPQVRLADGSRVPLGPRDGALLAWLALEGPTPRARLAQLLWPESEPESARNALRQRLFQLKKLLGVDVVSGGATLALAEGLAHDLAESDGVLGEGTHDFGPELAAWLVQQRERRRGRLRQSLVELSDMAAQARDYADALSHANELLTLEPLSEEAHRRVIQLHYLAGDRASALLAFDRCEQVLKDEVGARPSVETLALLATIEQSNTAQPPVAGGAMPASVSRPPRLIGRDAEMAELVQGWQVGQVTALCGEAGLGKSRLLQAFAEPRPGVIHVAARPGDGGVPFATLARLLRAVIACAPTTVQALQADVRNEVARVLPEVEPMLPRAAGEGQRLVMQRAVRSLLRSREDVVGLLVDDLHFADEASLEMLLALIDDEEGVGPAEHAPRWALAYRPAEMGSPLQALHDALVEQARLRPVTLEPLSEAALAELVDSLGLPGISGLALAPALRRRTGGNPLFVLETLKQAWVERTLAQLAEGQALPRPLSVGRLIERRVVQLSAGALALARVASIAGVDFSVALAEHVLGGSAMQFADALNELEFAHVLRGTQFAHDLVFDAVRNSVPAAIAQHTHAGVAAWLEQHAGEPARLARHWVAAAQPVRALPWLGRAAEAAGAALRGKEQIAFLEQQSAIEETAGLRAEAFASQMRAAELQVTLDGEAGRGLAQCDRLDALADTVPQRIRARLQRAHLLNMRGELSQSEALATTALREALRDGADPALVVDCRHHLATSLSLQDRSTEAVIQFQASIGWIDGHADDERRCEFHGNLAITYDNLGRLADSVPHHEITIELARRLGHYNNLAMTLGNYAANHIMRGHLPDGEALLLRARQVRTQADDASSIDGFGLMLQAICDYQSGRYRLALKALASSEEQLGRVAPGYRRAAQLHQAVCWGQLGQWGRLQHVLTEMGDVSQLRLATQLRVGLLRYQMAVALQHPTQPTVLLDTVARAGHEDLIDMQHALRIEAASAMEPLEGLRELTGIVDSATKLGHDGTLLAAHAHGARLSAMAGQAAQAREQVRAALALAERANFLRQYPGELWLHCGNALAMIGDTGAAAALFAQGRDWVQSVVRDQVPEEFRDSFLHRNPVNRELLALAARAG